MIQTFYQKRIQEIECIPLINNPIVFAKVKNPIFDYVTIEWFKPDQIYFSFRFEIFLNEIKFEKNQIECLKTCLFKNEMEAVNKICLDHHDVPEKNDSVAVETSDSNPIEIILRPQEYYKMNLNTIKAVKQNLENFGTDSFENFLSIVYCKEGLYS